jgi:16S rRNA (cytosine967-C5)-methyltransferase
MSQPPRGRGGGRSSSQRRRPPSGTRPAQDNRDSSRRRPQAGDPGAEGWTSRLAAAELLFMVMAEGQDFEAALSACESYGRLSGPDRGFARAMASAALRGLGRIDHALAGLSSRPFDALDPPVQAVLRIGAAQLWMMGSPAYAAVSATVEGAGRWTPSRRAGALVNAVLRRASRETDAFANAPATSVWPNWLAVRLRSELGEARAEAMAVAQLDEPTLDLVLKSPSEAGARAEQLGGVALPGGGVRIKAGVHLAELPGYAEGAWWVQDAAAALPARLLGAVAGRKVVDLCAAPGGKTLQLACAGADLVAIDISDARLAPLRDNVRRIGVAPQIVVADAGAWRPPEPVHAVLLDAPCSALGVLRRHPDAAWRRDPKDLQRFPRMQRTLLDAAWDMLQPGGRLVYSVCTPLSAEGRELVDAAIATGAWRRLPVTAEEVPGFAWALSPEGDLLTVGAPAGADADASVLGDGFFVARLEKTV